MPSLGGNKLKKNSFVLSSSSSPASPASTPSPVSLFNIFPLWWNITLRLSFLFAKCFFNVDLISFYDRAGSCELSSDFTFYILTTKLVDW